MAAWLSGALTVSTYFQTSGCSFGEAAQWSATIRQHHIGNTPQRGVLPYSLSKASKEDRGGLSF
ncbi:MAG: hypothetical protein PVF74_14395 [Anaerolineales bacterium]